MAARVARGAVRLNKFDGADTSIILWWFPAARHEVLLEETGSDTASMHAVIGPRWESACVLQIFTSGDGESHLANAVMDWWLAAGEEGSCQKILPCCLLQLGRVIASGRWR